MTAHRTHLLRHGWLLVAVWVSFAHGQWPHRAGQPLRSAPIVTDADDNVYVVNPDSDSVTKLGPMAAGAQPKRWEGAVGDYPRTLTIWGEHVLTVNQTGDSLSRLKRSDGTRDGADVELGFGCAPFGIVPDHSGQKVFVACQGTQEVVVLGADLAIRKRIALDWPQPRGLALSSDDTRLYVTHFLTNEPADDAHVSEIDAAADQLTPRRALVIPADLGTCETQNSGQGVTNIVNAIALTPPDAPGDVKNQLWVGGTLQNNITKGLFKRNPAFRGEPKLALFAKPCDPVDHGKSCTFEAFPRAVCQGGGNAGMFCATAAQCPGGACVSRPDTTEALKRNLYKASFHDVTRFVIWKLDLATGAVVGKIDVDEADHATDLSISDDGTRAYVIDQTFNSFHVFNTRRGQGPNPGTLFASVAKFGPYSADPSKSCDADALGSVTGEAQFIEGFEPQAQITPIDGFDPIRIDGVTTSAVNTGVDFDTRGYHQTGVAQMRLVPDAIGTSPMGVTLSSNGCIAYVANYLARNVVAVSAQPGNPGCVTAGQTVDFRCAGTPTQSCRSRRDCAGGQAFCNHPGGKACTADADCAPEPGPCITENECVPVIVGDPTPVTAIVSEEVPAEILDGKILFNTAARDASVENGIGLRRAAPLFNAVRRGCAQDPDIDCTTDAECGAGNGCSIVKSLPGEVVSTAHDASYVSCTSCHTDFGGQDGRTWDFSQFGGSLRNTMELRGRSRFAPGSCRMGLTANPTKIGDVCHFDAECGTSSMPGACGYDPNDDSKFPANVRTVDDRRRFFNPMMAVHWNGDRMEVEGFEFTYRMLLGAGDCDGNEHDPNKCLGALVPRVNVSSTSFLPQTGRFDGDLRAPLRNVMVMDASLGKELNASVRLTHMADFVYSLVEFPKNPNLGANAGAVSAAATRGQTIFNDQSVQCGSCHNGPSPQNQLFTDKGPNGGFVEGQEPGAATNSPYKRQNVGTANFFDTTDPELVAAQWGTYQNSTNKPLGSVPGTRGELRDYLTPVLNDSWNTPPFLHDGSALRLLDVVRPCDPDLDDCDQLGLGRNLKDQHGKTAHLTPQQLNDLVAFERAPHNPISTSETSVKAGGLRLKKVVLDFGRRTGKGSVAIIAEATPGALALDPTTGGGLQFTLAVPGGEAMTLIELMAPPGTVKGTARRFRAKAGAVKVAFVRRRGGTYTLTARGKRLDLEPLKNGARDVSVAVVAGGVQFVQNRVLAPKGKGARQLVLRTKVRRTAR